VPAAVAAGLPPLPGQTVLHRTAVSPLLLLAGLCLTAAAPPAEAQIYAWRDASGQLVLSDKARSDGGQATTYQVAGATPALRVTRPADARSARFDPLIETHAQHHGLEPDLVRAVIQVESGFNPYAVSPKGAMGLMQLMPATASELGVVNPFEPEQNIRGGVAYLKQLLARFDNKVELALAAYNAGPGAVDRYGQQVPPYRETQAYVKKITKGRTAAGPPPKPPIYKWFEVVDGRPVPRYSTRKPPADVAFEVISR
jgi:soluble lytic murein transglycosylase-like protein